MPRRKPASNDTTEFALFSPEATQDDLLHVQQQLTAVVDQLPEIPPLIRYYDSFDQQIRTIADFRVVNEVKLFRNGACALINFSNYEKSLAPLMKKFFVSMMRGGLSPSSIYNYCHAAYSIHSTDAAVLLTASPLKIRRTWESIKSKYNGSKGYALYALKHLMLLMCKYNINGWSDNYNNIISALPLPHRDKYKTIKSGKVFLNLEQQASIVKYLDDLTRKVSSKTTYFVVRDDVLQDACMLACAYQHGMRPVQIAMVTCRDIRIYNDDRHTNPAVHLTFLTAKQRSASAVKPMTRRMQRDWTPMFVELWQRWKVSDNGNGRIFGAKSASEVASRISNIASSCANSEVTARHLRHTAAQRLVDSGASIEEVAEFLGHADYRTCLVYFRSSPNQADIVDKSLKKSTIYTTVARIAHARFVTEDEISGLKGDQQIAGVTHGFAIAGIGGCSNGQPNCPYNPITSCYNCQKFMPVCNVAIHEKVLEDVKCVHNEFLLAARGDQHSPPLLQIERTIKCIECIIEEIREASKP